MGQLVDWTSSLADALGLPDPNTHSSHSSHDTSDDDDDNNDW